MRATITASIKHKGYQHFMLISTPLTSCGKMWKTTTTLDYRGKVGNLQIHKARAFVARQGEDGGVHVGVHMLLPELVIKALHGTLRGVVVFAQMAEENIGQPRMHEIPDRIGAFLVREMTVSAADAVLQFHGI